MNKILGQYFLKELTVTWFSVTFILLVVLATNKFADVIGDIASGDLPASSLFQIILYSSIDYLVVLIPLSTFLSILIVLGRFYKDQEMTAILSSGISPSFIYRILVIPMIFLTTLLFSISIYLSPEARKNIEFSKNDALSNIGIEFFEPGRFLTLKDRSVFYSKERYDDNRFIEVFLQTEVGNEVSVVTAEYAEIQTNKNDNFLVFFNGKRYQGKPGDIDFKVIEFAEHQLPLYIKENNEKDNDISTENFNFLLNAQDLKSKAELQWRVSPSIALIILVLLSIPLSRSSPRQGQYGGLVLGILIYMIYVNLLGAARVWFEQGDSPEIYGIWWVHAAALVFTFLMILSNYNFFSRLKRAGVKN